jgi:hypothetical protein
VQAERRTVRVVRVVRARFWSMYAKVTLRCARVALRSAAMCLSIEAGSGSEIASSRQAFMSAAEMNVISKPGGST